MELQKKMNDFKDLLAYKKAFILTMEIYDLTKNFLRRNFIHLQIRSGNPLVLFVQILLKDTENGNTRHILLARYQMQTWRRVKRKFELILLSNANI